MIDLSIVIPTCNRASLLYRSIQTLRSHLSCRFELIIVDGASTDDTPLVVESAQSVMGSRLRSIREEKREGFVKATNKGFRMARGRYLTWLNDDARPVENALEDAITLFRGCKMADCVTMVEQRLGQPTPPNFVKDLRARTAEAFKHALRPISGIEQALSEIQVPFCVASSGPPEKIRLALQVTGLLARFDPYIFSSYAVGSWKPEPDLFLYAAARMDVRPSACAVIEDSILGVRAGVAEGIKVFGYCTPSEATTFRGWGSHPYHVMSELPALLRQSR